MSKTRKLTSSQQPAALVLMGAVCHTLTLDISVFYIFWLSQGVTRVGTLGFCMSRGFVCLGVLYVYV
jgi:hypothetical protein